MKAGFAAGLLLVAAGATAQDPVLSDVAAGAVASAATGTSAKPVPKQDPNQAQKPLPAPSQQNSVPLKVVSVDSSRINGDETAWEGNVILEYKGYRLKANSIKGNRRTQIFVLTGGAELSGEGDVVSGEDVTVDFDKETYTFSGGKAAITPTRLQGYATDKFYVSAGAGELRAKHYHVTNAKLTSCDREHPHYAFLVRDGEIIPGDRITIEGFGLEIGGKTLFRLPKIVIPLLDDRPRYTPEVGHSNDEGYYIKSRYATPLGGRDILDTRLDYMTKLGFGLGADYSYFKPTMSGLASVYGITGSRNTKLAKLNHQQRFGSSQLALDATWQQNNYLASPQTTLSNIRGQLNIPSKTGQTTLAFYQSGTSNGTFDSNNGNFSLTDTRKFGSGLRTTLNATLSSNSSKSGSTSLSDSERLDLRFQGTQELRSLTADLLYQRTVPVSGTQSFYASNRTPLLTLTSDTRRLFGERFGQKWPFQAQFAVGELEDPGSAGPISRFWFDLRGGQSERLSKRLSLSWNTQFSQGVYSDDTAQYVVAYSGQANYGFAKDSSLRLNYQRLKQVGYTPLSLDLTGKSDSFDLGFQWAFAPGWTTNISTGYDLLSIERGLTPWRMVQVGANYRHKQDKFLFSTAYDTFNQNWSYIRAEGQFQLGDVLLAAAARYDGQRSKLAAATVQVYGLKSGPFTADFILSYNGYTNSFDAQQYSISYDMHCTEAVLEFTDFRSGFRSGTQIAFYIRIKALPFGGDFGYGRRGQRIGGIGGFGG